MSGKLIDTMEKSIGFAIIAFILLVTSMQVDAQSNTTGSFSGGDASSASIGSSSASNDIALYTIPQAPNRTYLVGLRATPKGNNICVGALIGSNSVVTSHCPMIVNGKAKQKGVVNSDKNSYNIQYASIGNRYRNGDSYGQVIKIYGWIRHPNYNAKTDAYSVSVFVLAQKTTLKPIPLGSASDDDLNEGQPTTTMGWVHDGVSAFLYVVNMQFYGQTPCAKILGIGGWKLDDSNVCTIPAKSTDACQLEPGSPLIIDQGGEERLVGVMNFNYACGSTNMPIVYSRMADKQYDWIMMVAGLSWPYYTDI